MCGIAGVINKKKTVKIRVQLSKKRRRSFSPKKEEVDDVQSNGRWEMWEEQLRSRKA